MDFHADEAGLGKHSRQERGAHAGKTVRAHQKARNKDGKREHSTITTASDVAGLPSASQPLSLDKAKRWELLDDPNIQVLSIDVKDSKQDRIHHNRTVDTANRRRAARQEDGSDSSSDSEDSSLDETNLKDKYRITKGGQKGVMISKRRTPGKKGVKKQQNQSDSDSESGSGPSDEGEHAGQRGMLVVETASHSKIRHHERGYKGCNCEYCNPAIGATREGKKARLADEIRNL